MNWRNIKLIWARELRDQLRDRRTLFVVAVLPVLMYPLLGMSFLQLAQFMQQHRGRVLVVGSEQLDGELPPLVSGDQFAPELFDSPESQALLEVEYLTLQQIDLAPSLVEAGGAEAPAGEGTGVGVADSVAEGSAAQRSPAENSAVDNSSGEPDPLVAARDRLRVGGLDVIVYFPPDFSERLEQLRAQLSDRDSVPEFSPDAIRPVVIFNSTEESSQVSQLRVQQVLDRWRSTIVSDNLAASHVPQMAARPFDLEQYDIAEPERRRAATWSKLLPFIVFLWALTGAFYPAVDLCAGEKERGTLETLLSSPALRSEIVCGKLLTISCFSVFTAILNLISLGLTGRFVMQQLSASALGGALELGMPPLTSLLWLLVALVPMAALFSALSLACASLARSTKEGQYYFMPLFMVAMPLILMPMSPGVELSLGSSLVPVMGLVLLLRAFIEGQYATAGPFVLPVILVTLGCCALAARWAVWQFHQESVLFHEGERFNLWRQLKALVRYRGDTPSLSAAVACVVVVFMMQFFVQIGLSARLPTNPGFSYFATTHVVSQVLCFALPAVLMAFLLSKKPWRTLSLDRFPTAGALALSVLLAVVLHPAGLQLADLIQSNFPLGEAKEEALRAFMNVLLVGGGPIMILLLLAVVPAICEELAFRGFILSGLRSSGSDAWAIVLSAAVFGAAHSVLAVQQALSASILGLVVGYLVVRTGSLLCGMAFHVAYNSLQMGLSMSAGWLAARLEAWDLNGIVFRQIDQEAVCYHPVLVILGGLAATAILYGLGRDRRRAAAATPLLDAVL